MATTNEKTFLAIGGNGKTGIRVVQKLKQAGHAVRIGSRKGMPRFDWEDTSTWQPALQNMHAVYITFQPDLAAPGSVEAIRILAELAVKNGVRKLVLLSGRGEAKAQQCEEVVQKCGIPWTIVRASWFNQNFSESYLLDPVLAGHVALPAGAVGEPFVDTEDIADVVVAALTDSRHDGELYEVTGPRLLTFQEAIHEIAAATGKTIVYEQIPIEAYVAMLTQYSVPQDIIGLLQYLFTDVLDGRNASVADGIQRALGRKPTDFSAYVKRTVATGVWG